MTILTLRTDKPESEIGLYDDGSQLVYEVWEAHRQLAETLHKKIEKILHDHQKKWGDVAGIVVYSGPGSFTGLRIGISTANALAYANGCKIVGVTGENWAARGIDAILSGNGLEQVLPYYGSEAYITAPKK